MYYRSTYNSELFNDLSLYTYLKSTQILDIVEHDTSDDENEKAMKKKKDIYNFKNVIEYYESKTEYDYVGIIDKSSFNKRSIDEDIPDTFKLRIRREKILKKKRGTGIPSITGSVCETSKKKKELINIAKQLDIKIDKSIDKEESRVSVCKLIRNRLLYLEKYSTTKDNNKFTYLIVPSNHPIYPFPLNLEDRIVHILKQLEKKIPFKIEHKVEKLGNGIFEGSRDKKLPTYLLKIPITKDLNKFDGYFKSLHFKIENSSYTILIE
jgi:hypothetical protein